MEAVARAEAMMGAAYLHDLHGLLSLCSNRTQDRQPRGGTVYSGLGPT